MKNPFLLIALILTPLFSQASNLSPSFSLHTQAADQYYNYNFGTVRVNFAHSVDFILKAEGPESTRVQEIHIQGMEYSARTNCPLVLPVGQTCATRVTFWPSRDGFFPGRLIYFLGDNNIVIDLAGWAQR